MFSFSNLRLYILGVADALVAAITAFATLDLISRVVGLIISITLFIYARYKFLQDMRLKKLDEQIKMKELERMNQKTPNSNGTPA